MSATDAMGGGGYSFTTESSMAERLDYWREACALSNKMREELAVDLKLANTEITRCREIAERDGKDYSDAIKALLETREALAQWADHSGDPKSKAVLAKYDHLVPEAHNAH